MLKTNNKEVKKAVRNYVIESMENASEEYNTLKGLLASAIDWYYSGNARKITRYGYTHFEYDQTIGEFLTNSAGIFTFYTQEQKELIKDWLQETEEEADRFNNIQIETLFYRLITTAFHELRLENDLNIIENETDLMINNAILSEYL